MVSHEENGNIFLLPLTSTVNKKISALVDKVILELFMIHLLNSVVLSPGGSITVHIYAQTNRTTQITTNLEECGPRPDFVSFTLAFALKLRKKHGKTSVRVRKTTVRVRKTTVRVRKTSVRVRKTCQGTVYTYILPKHPHITKPTHIHTHTQTHTHTNTHTHAHTTTY